MRRKRVWKAGVSALLISCLVGTTAVSAADAPSFGNTQQSYTHGSSETVSESELKTEVPSGYDVNKDTQAKAKEGAYAKLFDTESMQTVNITIDENNWNYLLQNANEKPYVLADQVSIGEESISYVGLKTKGNLTLNQVWQSDSDRFSFTVNVSKYIKKKNGYSETQNFYGLEKFSLNNVYGDASYMKEYLSYELMTAMGVATPYYALVKLCINGEYWGVYCMVENVDESLVKRTLDTGADGDLYKNESPGGDLLYNDALDAYLSGESSYDFSTYSDASNVLSGYTGILDNKEMGTTIDDYQTDLAAAATDAEKEAVTAEYQDTLTTDCNELFTWMKALNVLNETEDADTSGYESSLEKILDVDEALRYFAANTYLVNLDSYQSEKQQNYCIYLVNGKASIIPWDYNYSFGGYGVDDASEMINFNVDTPVIDVTLAERPLLNVLLKNATYREKYESYLKDCAAIATNGGTVNGASYEENHFQNELMNYKENILADVLSQSSVEEPFYTYEQYQSAVENLILLINQRSAAVVNQVNDDFTEVDANGANLSTIGNVTRGATDGMQTPPDGAPSMPDGTPPAGAPDGTPPAGGMTPPSDVPAASMTPETSASPAPAESATESPAATASPAATGSPAVTATPDTVAVQKVTLNKTSVSLKPGKTVALKASIAPASATNKNVTFSSSNTSVATVSKSGIVTAVSKGEAVITCKASDGSGCLASCKVNVSRLDAVTKIKAKKVTASTVSLSFKSVSGATGYQVLRYDSSKKAYVEVATVSKNACTIKGLSAGTTYKFKVRAITKVNKTVTYGTKSAAYKVSTAMKTPALTLKKRTATKATLKLKKVTGASYYIVYRAAEKSGTYKKAGTVKASATTFSDSGLKKNKTYYYKVRACKVVNGKKTYSSYSKAVKVKA